MGTRRSRDHINFTAATIAADVVTNTTAATAFSQKLTIKANTPKVGDLYRVRAVVKTPSTNSTDTLALAMKIADITICETTATNATNNDVWILEAWFVYQAVGAASTAAITGGGVGYLGGATAISKAKAFARTTSSNFATTTDEDITVVATWSVQSTDNDAVLEALYLEQVDGLMAS